MLNNNVKQAAKLKVPFIVSIKSSNDFGTSIDTMINVNANANAASLKVSIREGSWLRHFMVSALLICAAAFALIVKN
jgi:hypothetical protein